MSIVQLFFFFFLPLNGHNFVICYKLEFTETVHTQNIEEKSIPILYFLLVAPWDQIQCSLHFNVHSTDPHNKFQLWLQIQQLCSTLLIYFKIGEAESGLFGLQGHPPDHTYRKVAECQASQLVRLNHQNLPVPSKNNRQSTLHKM